MAPNNIQLPLGFQRVAMQEMAAERYLIDASESSDLWTAISRDPRVDLDLSRRSAGFLVRMLTLKLTLSSIPLKCLLFLWSEKQVEA